MADDGRLTKDEIEAFQGGGVPYGSEEWTDVQGLTDAAARKMAWHEMNWFRDQCKNVAVKPAYRSMVLKLVRIREQELKVTRIQPWPDVPEVE